MVPLRAGAGASDERGLPSQRFSGAGPQRIAKPVAGDWRRDQIVVDMA